MTHHHWSSYWQTGVTGSFGVNEPQWYKETLEPFWEEIFSTLPKNISIIDIATGNGAVAKIAQKVSEDLKKEFKITATDKARHSQSNDPQSSTKSDQQHKIEYLFNTPIESLVFQNKQFDLISSQFGIEYSNTFKALSNLKKCLKPSGEMVFIIHHKNSIITNQSQHEVKQYRIILEQYSIFEKLKSLLTSMGEINSPADLEILKSNKKAAKARDSFNLLVNKLTSKNPQAIVIAELLNMIKPLFKEMMMKPVKEKIKYLHAIKLQMQQARQRLLDMLEAAFDENKLKRFIQQAERTGFSDITSEMLMDDSDHLIAWKIKLKNQ